MFLYSIERECRVNKEITHSIYLTVKILLANLIFSFHAKFEAHADFLTKFQQFLCKAQKAKVHVIRLHRFTVFQLNVAV